MSSTCQHPRVRFASNREPIGWRKAGETRDTKRAWMTELPLTRGETGYDRQSCEGEVL